MTGTDPMRIADALCARLCHDISSPLGTLSGALEMITEDPDASAEALPLAAEVAQSLKARIRLLRAAWTGDCGPLDAVSLSALAAGLPSRIRVDLSGIPAGLAYSPELSRLLLNLILLGADALPRGGAVALSSAPGEDILVTLDGPSAAWPPNLASALAGAEADWREPRAVQAPLVGLLARAAGRRLSFLMAAGYDAGPPPLLLAAN